MTAVAERAITLSPGQSLTLMRFLQFITDIKKQVPAGGVTAENHARVVRGRDVGMAQWVTCASLGAAALNADGAAHGGHQRARRF
jgi:hypothetical protein